MDFAKTNSAVIKTIFSTMDKQTFIKNGKDLKHELIINYAQRTNENYLTKLISLHIWISSEYRRKFMYKTHLIQK